MEPQLTPRTAPPNSDFGLQQFGVRLDLRQLLFDFSEKNFQFCGAQIHVDRGRVLDILGSANGHK